MDTCFSVIVPVYNKQDYLQKCIDSLIHQTYKNLEIVLVDDGSTDKSGLICDEYASLDERIRVIHQKNKGLSCARNVGIKVATGDYLSFLDADDYWEQNTYELFAKAIEQNNPDILDCKLQYIFNGTAMPPQGHSHPKNCILERTYILKEIVPALTNLPSEREKFILDYSCNKVFSRTLVQDNEIYFDEDRRKWEDRPFVAECVAHCQNMYCLSECLYNYVGVESSLASSFDKEIFRSTIKNYRLYERLFGDLYDYHTSEVYGIWFGKIYAVAYDLIANHYDKYSDLICEMFEECFSDDTVLLWMEEWRPKHKEEQNIQMHVLKKDWDSVIKDYFRVVEKDKERQKREKSVIIRGIRKIVQLFNTNK